MLEPFLSTAGLPVNRLQIDPLPQGRPLADALGTAARALVLEAQALRRQMPRRVGFALSAEEHALLNAASLCLSLAERTRP